MQIKNKFNVLIVLFISLFLINFEIKAEEFNITAKEIVIDKDKEILALIEKKSPKKDKESSKKQTRIKLMSSFVIIVKSS